MAISFSGLASGMDTSSWVEALVSVKQSEITKLESDRSTIAAAQDTLNNIKSYFNSFQSLLESVTDAKFGIASRDLFTQNLAESSNVSVVSAIASTSAENTTYNIEVNQLATATEVNSGLYTTVANTTSAIATMDSTLFSLADNEHAITAGNITFSIDGNTRTVSVNEETTIGSFISSLESIGISASYNEETGIFSLGVSVQDNTSSLRISSDATGVISALGLQDVNYGYDTGVIDIITTTTVSGTATAESKLKDLGIDAGHLSFQIKTAGKITTSGGVIQDLAETDVATINTFSQESTLGDVLNKLEEYGIHATFNNDGTLTLTSDRVTTSTAEGEKITYKVLRGNLADALGFSEFGDPEVALTKMTSTAIVNSTIETVIHRDSTLAQIGAVTGAGDNLVIRKCDDGEEVATITTLTANSTVQDFFNAITAYGITGTISDGVITLNSTSGNFIDGNIATNIGILQPVVETYYTTAPTTMTSSGTINTAMSLGALGMSSDGSVVIYSPVYGIVSVNIAKELTVQGFCDKINDSNYGIHAEISGNKVKLTELDGSEAYVKGMSTVIQNALKLSVGEGNSYNSTAHNIYTNTDSSYIEYDDTGVEINGNTVISSINGYSQGNGQIRLHNGSQISTITVDSTLTLEEFINNPIVGLAQYGLSGQVLSDGKAYITANSEIYLEEISGGSNILSALKLSNLQTTWSGDHVDGINAMQFTLTITTTVAATKDTALNTWDRGNTTVVNGQTKTIQAAGTMVFKTNDYYKTVNIEDGDTFQTLIDKLSAIGINAYISRGEFYIASGYDNVEYVANESSSFLADLIHMSGPKNLGGYSASSQPVISTVTTNEDKKISAANYADMSTRLSTMGISTGKLTVYKNGQRADIYIKDDDEYENGYTFSLFQSDLASKFGDLRVSFDDGKLKIYSEDSTANISIGSTSDQSNFVAITGISSAKNNELTSSRQLYKMNDRTAVTTEGIFRNGTVTTGSFKVGDADIYVQEGTTIADIISQINASEKSLANAYWDSIDGKLVIKSTLTGASAINIESGDTNFTDLLGLTNDDNLVMSSQTIGKNAILTINGATYTSLSNNVTSDSTGLTGLTINLKGLTSGSAVQLTVKRDTESLANAVQNIVDGYNELLTNIDNVISKSGKLKDQSMLKLIRNNIRTAMTSSDLGTTKYKNLSAIGIKASDAAAGNISTSSSDITMLTLNKEEFIKALEGDEDAVKALLIGSTDGAGNVINEGIFQKVYKQVFQALSANGGYFDTANKAYNKDKERISQKIVNGTAAIAKYRAKLEKKFSVMDTMIADMQNQFKSFLG